MARTPLRRAVALLLLLVVGAATIIPARHATANQPPWRDKSSPFGVVSATANRVRSDEMPAYVGLLREAGVQWSREEFFWDRLQFQPDGPFRWGGDEAGMYNYDRSVQLLSESGISILGLLDYNPAWFKGQNPPLDAWIGDWGDYVYEVVARYGRNGPIKHWEIWNEPNLTPSGYESGLYEIKDYVRILGTAQAAARAADPGAVIVLGGLASVWIYPPSPTTYDYFDYLDQIGKLGGWSFFDIVAVHPYRPDAPEGEAFRRDNQQTFRDEMWRLDQLMGRYGHKPVWLTEMGWASNRAWPGVGEDQQGQFLARVYIMAMAMPSIEKIFWYDFRDDNLPGVPYDRPAYDGSHHELHFGLLRRTYPLNPAAPGLRKPAFLAYRALTGILSGLALHEVAADGSRKDMPATHWYRFGGPRRVDVLWNTDSPDQRVTIPCSCREALVRTWTGQVRYQVYPQNGVFELRLDEQGSPMYLEFDPPPIGEEQVQGTRHSLRGAFRDFWHARGGVARFGLPLTEEILEPSPFGGQPRPVQYFERARFEYYPELAGTPYAVQLSLLGDAVLRRAGTDWQLLPKLAEAPPECQLFPDTGHSVCPPFLERWQALGGTELMGNPITEPFTAERPGGGPSYTVQYFQRARLELFPELAGTPGEIQLGLLGAELLVGGR